MLNKKNGLSRHRIGKLVRCFCADLTASQERDLAAFSGIVEVDESCFGAERVCGHPGPRKRGRGTLKQPVFGIFDRGGRVNDEVIPDAKARTLREVIRGHIALDAELVTDGWRGYNGLVNVGYDRHLHINKSKHFAENGVHVNGIESSRSFTKCRLAKFNGCKANFRLPLKECEWRWDKDFDTLVRELNRLMV